MELIRYVKTASAERGLLLNTKKTKIMVVNNTQNGADDVFSLDGDAIDQVDSLEFLGSIINNRGDCSQEIKRRLHSKLQGFNLNP